MKKQRAPNTLHVHMYLKLFVTEPNKLQIINYKG
jgi:hypothetical protein